MKIESIAVSDLIEDPSNVRKHSQKNIAAIKGSLAKFGQQKPIVVDKDNVVLAGNGTLAAAKALGWKSINIVRTSLQGSEAIAYAIADNRTAELAEWDDDLLSVTIQGLLDDGIDVESIGFEKQDLDKWLKRDNQDGDNDTPKINEEYLIVVNCKDESQQRDVFERLVSEGLECKLMS